MVSEETLLVQAPRAPSDHWASRMKTEAPAAQTQGSVWKLEELLTQDPGSCTETRGAPQNMTRGALLHTERPQPGERALVLNKPWSLGWHSFAAASPPPGAMALGWGQRGDTRYGPQTGSCPKAPSPYSHPTASCLPAHLRL